MSFHVMGVTAGRKNSNSEILLKEASDRSGQIAEIQRNAVSGIRLEKDAVSGIRLKKRY